MYVYGEPVKERLDLKGKNTAANFLFDRTYHKSGEELREERKAKSRERHGYKDEQLHIGR